MDEATMVVFIDHFVCQRCVCVIDDGDGGPNWTPFGWYLISRNVLSDATLLYTVKVH